MQHFAIRTVRHGRVKIKGRWFTPRDEYHGELDGQRFAFGLYWVGNQQQPFVYLLGTESGYHNFNFEGQPNLIDGVFYWDWWNLIEEAESDQSTSESTG